MLRIANLSASLTYVLDLVDTAAPDRNASELLLCVISIDGVVTGGGTTPCSKAQSASESATYTNVGFGLKQLLLMPGSRAEILLTYDGLSAVRTLMLRTIGLNMGNSEAGSQGDQWPAIDLMRMTVDPPAGPSTMVVPPLQASLVRTRNAAVPAPAGALGPVPSGSSATPNARPLCQFLPSGSHDYRRQLIFDEAEGGHGTFDDQATYHGGFALGSRIVSGVATILPNSLIGPRDYSVAHHGPTHPLPTTRHLCARLGHDEVWELTNWTSETHNFHIHQGKFRLARSGDPGLPPDFHAPIEGEPASGSPIMAYLSVLTGAGDVQAWHDTLPVPPRISKTQPGRVYVYIPFQAEEQVGNFVFHCHILEHEDRGMMADVEVVHDESGHAAHN